MGLIHGSAPHAFVLCQLAGSTEVEGYPGVPLPPLAELVELHERISLTSRRAPVACIALNTRHLDDDGARAAIEAAAAGDGPRRRRPLPLRRGAAPGRRACASRGLGRLEVHDLAYAHTLMSLPIAALLMKSFFDDIPADLDSAAMIDGAGRFGCFRCLPLMRGGLAATAVLCFIFSWTEFLISLQLTTEIRTIPVKIPAGGEVHANLNPTRRLQR